MIAVVTEVWEMTERLPYRKDLDTSPSEVLAT